MQELPRKHRIGRFFKRPDKPLLPGVGEATPVIAEALNGVLEEYGLSAYMEAVSDQKHGAILICLAPAPIAAPDHAEAKSHKLRFRHLHDDHGRLRGTIVAHGTDDGQVRCAITMAAPVDQHRATRSEGRDRAYQRLLDGDFTTLTVESFKSMLYREELVPFLVKATGLVCSPKSIRGVK